MVLVDLNMTGWGHWEFNKGVISLVNNTGVKYDIWGETKLVENVRLANISSNLRVLHGFYFPQANSKPKLMLREIIGLFICVRLLFKYKDEPIVFLSIIPFCHLVVKILNLVFFKRQISVILHAEIECLGRPPRYLFEYYYKISCFCLTRFNSRWLKYTVLGESILSNLAKFVGKHLSFFSYIHHPFVFERPISLKKSSQNQIILGGVGKALIEVKNSHYIFLLADHIYKVQTKEKPVLRLIGLVSSSVLKFDNGLVQYTAHEQFLGKDSFERQVDNLHFILLFYDHDAYSLSASGVFFDALKYGKPVIAISNSYFEYYFQIFGEIGFLAKDFSDLCLRVEKYMNMDPVDFWALYNQYLKNIENARILLNEETPKLFNQIL